MTFNLAATMNCGIFEIHFAWDFQELLDSDWTIFCGLRLLPEESVKAQIDSQFKTRY